MQSRNAFWDTLVTPLINSSVNVSLDMRGVCSDVDASAAPLSHRTGKVLRSAYQDVRAGFTKIHSNWSASGQNQSDVQSFMPFWPRSTIRGTMTAAAKCIVFLFVAFKCGTEQENTQCLDITIRSARSSASLENGSIKESIAASSARKRHDRNRSNSASDFDKFTSIIETSVGGLAKSIAIVPREETSDTDTARTRVQSRVWLGRVGYARARAVGSIRGGTQTAFRLGNCGQTATRSKTTVLLVS